MFFFFVFSEVVFQNESILIHGKEISRTKFSDRLILDIEGNSVVTKEEKIKGLKNFKIQNLESVDQKNQFRILLDFEEGFKEKLTNNSDGIQISFEEKVSPFSYRSVFFVLFAFILIFFLLLVKRKKSSLFFTSDVKFLGRKMVHPGLVIQALEIDGQRVLLAEGKSSMTQIFLKDFGKELGENDEMDFA